MMPDVQQPSDGSASAEVSAPLIREETRILGGHQAPLWKPALLATIVVMVVFFGAGRQMWSLGLAMSLAGLAALFSPPALRLPGVPWIALMSAGLAPLAGLLPVSWAGGMPSWRTSLVYDWGIRIPSTISPDPQATVESWLVVAVMILWAWLCLGQGFSRVALRLALSILALGGAALAAASFFDLHVSSIPWWSRAGVTLGDGFGPFANRNHSSSLNAISAILCLSLALDGWRRRSHIWGVFALAFLLPAVAIFMNTSRGGLILFFLGLIVWAMTASSGKGWVRKVMLVVALFLVLFSVAFVSSGRLGGRLRDLASKGEGAVVESSLRLDLARETLRIGSDQPWVGSGFGTFNTVFSQVSHLKQGDLRFFHPESDVLMLFFEGGMAALLPCGVFLVWAAFSSGPWQRSGELGRSRDRSGRPLRQAAAIGAGMALTHAVFDIPHHGTGYAMHTLLLLGLAVRPQRLGSETGWLGAGFFRLAGVAAIALGILWAGIDWGKWKPDVSSSVLALRRQAKEQAGQGRYREALVSIDRAIWLGPLDYRLYYTRAQLLLQLRQNPERALLDFGRARVLEPHYAPLCFEEGEFWLSYVPDMAIIPWRECLRRLPRESELSRRYYGQMLSLLGPHPQLREPLWRLVESADMQIVFLSQTSPGDLWQQALQRFFESQPQLERLDPATLRHLFRMWHDLGDRTALAALLSANPRLQAYGWRTLAYEEARMGRYQEAVLVAARFLKRQEKPSWSETSNLSRLERAFVLNPSDPRPGVELYYAQRATGDLKAARATAEKVAALPNSPPYMKLELATLYAELKEDRLAWEMMEQAIQVVPEI